MQPALGDVTVTPPRLESLVAQWKRCKGDARHSAACRRCKRGVEHARRNMRGGGE